MIITYGVIDWLIENRFPPLYFWADNVAGFQILGKHNKLTGDCRIGNGNGDGCPYGNGDGDGFGIGARWNLSVIYSTGVGY